MTRAAIVSITLESADQLDELKKRARSAGYAGVSAYGRHLLGFPPMAERRGKHGKHRTKKRRRMSQPTLFPVETLSDDPTVLRAEVAELRARLAALEPPPVSKSA